MASRVALEPAPAMTKARPAATLTVVRITASASSSLSVAASPVVPTGTSPVTPAAICASISFSSAGVSTAPSRNGVTRAVKTPASRRRKVGSIIGLAPCIVSR